MCNNPRVWNWKDLAFQLDVALVSNGDTTMSVGIMGVARGVREKDNLRCATFVNLPVAQYPKGFEWTQIALLRLDTFWDCDCVEDRVCEKHAKLCVGWNNADDFLSRPARKV